MINVFYNLRHGRELLESYNTEEEARQEYDCMNDPECTLERAEVEFDDFGNSEVLSREVICGPDNSWLYDECDGGEDCCHGTDPNCPRCNQENKYDRPIEDFYDDEVLSQWEDDFDIDPNEEDEDDSFDFEDEIEDNLFEALDYDKLAEELEELEDEVECKWCGELVPKTDCRKEQDLGYVCSYCQQAIQSHGEPMLFVESDNRVVPCEVAEVIAHCKDEKPLDCKMKKKPLQRPLTEADEEVKEKSSAGKAEAEKVINKLEDAKSYTEFVKILNSDGKSKAFLDYLKKHYSDGDIPTVKKSNPTKGKIRCDKLQVTQNNISLSKSILDPLTKSPDWAIKIIKTPLEAFKDPIITYAGKYIIDGHHRWSKAYALAGPEAYVPVLNFPAVEGVDWKDMLKAVQLANLAANPNYKLINGVGDDNMLKMSKDAIIEKVKPLITDKFISTYKSVKSELSDTDKIVNFIGDNCAKMQSTCGDPSGKPARDVMPQTDNAEGSIELLQKNIIDLTEALGLVDEEPVDYLANNIPCFDDDCMAESLEEDSWDWDDNSSDEIEFSAEEDIIRSKSKVDYDALIADEEEAIDGYTEEMRNSDLKEYSLLKHIRDEEEEHIQELENACNGIFEN